MNRDLNAALALGSFCILLPLGKSVVILTGFFTLLPLVNVCEVTFDAFVPLVSFWEESLMTFETLLPLVNFESVLTGSLNFACLLVLGPQSASADSDVAVSHFCFFAFFAF